MFPSDSCFVHFCKTNHAIREIVNLCLYFIHKASRIFTSRSADCSHHTVHQSKHFVFVIPVAETLDLKKAARAAGVKSIAMLPQKKLLPLTGYVHSGCSPVGMSKHFPTYFAEEVILVDTMICSAGKVGHQFEVAPDALIALVDGQVADLTVQ